MNKVRRNYGELKKELVSVYWALRWLGYAHKAIQSLTVRKALLAYFGSEQAIDAVFGAGAYQGTKDSRGPFAHLRKVWDRIRKEQRELQPARNASLVTLTAALETCKHLDLSEREVLFLVQRTFRARRLLAAS